MSHVFTLSRSQQLELRAFLEESDEALEPAPHAHFRMKRPDLTLTLYESGKLLVQGKGADDFVATTLSPLVIERKVTPPASPSRSSPSRPSPSRPSPSRLVGGHIGNDEAGKGDFFGPLVIAGVGASSDEIQTLKRLGVMDSKKVEDRHVHRLSDQIQQAAPTRFIILRPARYNVLYGHFRNLNHLLGWAHTRVLQELAQASGLRTALLDQFARPSLVEGMVRQAGIPIQLHQRPRAESDPVVAAASIVARSLFLNELAQLERDFKVRLPKGAGPPVLEAARKLAHTAPHELFSQVAKLHFKTLDQVVGASDALSIRRAATEKKDPHS